MAVVIEDIDIRKKECLKYYWDKRDRNLVSRVSGIRKQKVMLFYNLFAFCKSKEYTFENLKAYEQGPVYEDVYNYVKKNKFKYIETQVGQITKIDKSIMSDVTYLIDLQTDEELSELSHMNFWEKSFNNPISKHISKEDITESDKKSIEFLMDYVRDLKRYNFEKRLNKNKNIILFNKHEVSEEEYESIKDSIDEKYNPVYLLKDDEGELYFD